KKAPPKRRSESVCCGPAAISLANRTREIRSAAVRQHVRGGEAECRLKNFKESSPMKQVILRVFLALPLMADNQIDEHTKRIHESAAVFGEIMQADDKGIPQDLLQNAQCVGVVPNLKRAGFIVGGKYGKGVLTCRTLGPAGWSAPSSIRIEGGSVGFQIGAGETDVVFVVMNRRGVDKLMEDKFT